MAKEEEIHRREYWRLGIGSFILLIGVTIAIAVLFHTSNLTGVGVFGVIVLFTVLIGGNILSGSFNLSTAEVRRAISISVVAVFFAFLGVADKITVEKNLLAPVMDKFWWIIVTIIVFYFGGRTLEKIIKK